MPADLDTPSDPEKTPPETPEETYARRPEFRLPRMRFLHCATVVALMALQSCGREPARTLTYTLEISKTLPRVLTVTLRVRGATGPLLVLQAHAASQVMGIERFEVTSFDGRALPWNERAETTRVNGTPLQIASYRIAGPIPSELRVRYRVTLGKREGDAHIGYTGRCFGYLGPEHALFSGRDVFLVPRSPESYSSIRVDASVPDGWSVLTPWRWDRSAWAVDGVSGPKAENLVASTLGLGAFQEREFAAGKTRVRIAYPRSAEPSQVDGATTAIEHVVRYLHGVFGRDLGAAYLVIAAPPTPDADDIAGGAWSNGQGGTLLPVSVERLRGFAEEFARAYVRYPGSRTEISRPEELWLVDAIPMYYGRRAVASAGLANDAGVERILASGYLSAMATLGVNRNVEALYTSPTADRTAREQIAPYLLLHLDHELRRAAGAPRGLDSILPMLLAGRSAPSLWSLLPRAPVCDWDSFRSYVRGTRIAPVPELFDLPPTGPRPTPPGGPRTSHLTLVYTGNTDGYLENCGCKANESGGVARRATVLDSIRRNDPEAVLLDAGSSFNRPEPFESPNALATYEQRFYLLLMDRMGYAAAAIGTGELARGRQYFLTAARGLRTPFIAANVGADGLNAPCSTVLRAHGRRIGVIGVFEPPQGGRSMLLLDQRLSEFRIEDPVASVLRESRSLRPRVDLVIAMGKLAPSTIRRLVATDPDLDIVISTDSSAPQWADGPAGSHRVILEDDRSGFLGGTLVLYASLGQYGLSAADLGLDASGRIAEAEPRDLWLPDAVRDQAAVREELNRFYDRVGTLPEAQASVRPPLADDAYWKDKRYAGSDACRGCHMTEYTQWKSTAHAGAFKTLLDRHRHYQPVCISCHVVGYGSRYGYRIGQGEHPLGNVQCEMCHGPGSEHVASPRADNIRRHVPEQVCVQCHTPEHSRDFVYSQRLPLVEHRGEAVSLR